MSDYSNHVPGFTKLFSGLIHSTVWREEMHVKVVWVTMLALADRNGEVLASLPGLADASRVSIEQCQDALKRLSAPDKYSRTKEHGGRRIEEIDGGWCLLNYLKYRQLRDDVNRREQIRNAVRKHREKKEDNVINVSHVIRSKPIAEAEAEADLRAEKTSQPSRSVSESESKSISPAKKPSQAEETARRYVAVLDAVTGRKTRKLAPDIVKATAARLKDWEPWQIVAVPILVFAQGRKDKYSPDVFLRNGEHPRTRNGNSFGGYYWLSRTYERADGTRLDARLESIARQAGVLDKLEELGVTTEKTS